MYGINVNVQPFSGVNQEYANRLTEYAKQVMPSIYYRCPKAHSHYVNQYQLPANPAMLGLNWSVDQDMHLCFPKSGKLPLGKVYNPLNLKDYGLGAQSPSTYRNRVQSAAMLGALSGNLPGAASAGTLASLSKLKTPYISPTVLSASLLQQQQPSQTEDLSASISSLEKALGNTASELSASASALSGGALSALSVPDEAVQAAQQVVGAIEQKHVIAEQERYAADVLKLAGILKKHNPQLSAPQAAAQAATMASEAMSCARVSKSEVGESGDGCKISSTPHSDVVLPPTLAELQKLRNTSEDAAKEAAALIAWYRTYAAKKKRIGFGVESEMDKVIEIQKITAILQQFRPDGADVSDEATQIFAQSQTCAGTAGNPQACAQAAASGECSIVNLLSGKPSCLPSELASRAEAVKQAKKVNARTKDLNAWYRSFYTKQKDHRTNK